MIYTPKLELLANFDHGDIYYQSGIKYFASNPSASFSFTGSNFYSNVYSNEAAAISFPTTPCPLAGHQKGEDEEEEEKKKNDEKFAGPKAQGV